MNFNIKEIEKRITDEADKSFVTEKLTHFMDSTDRQRLESISSELFEYEKRYVLPYPEDCGLLVLNVGMREAPVILSILAVSPNKVVLLYTEGSKRIAIRVKEDVGVVALGIQITLVLIDEIDAAKNYMVLKENIIEKYGRFKEGMLIDPTGGRKMMGISLGAVAFFFRIPMIYLHADEKMGLAVPFSGRVKKIDNPYEYYGDIELYLLCDYFNSYSFDAASRICTSLRNTVKDNLLYVKLELVDNLIEIYRDWDMFSHSKHFVSSRNMPAGLCERLKGVVEKMKRLDQTIVKEKDISHNIEFLRRIDCGYKCKKNICDKYRLVDLFCNAKRREAEGKYDDAVARLYRSLEMCSTIALDGYGIGDVAEPDYDSFSKSIGKSVEEIKIELQKELGLDYVPERLALGAQMVLLGIAGSKIADIHKRMRGGGQDDSLMEKRNRSILAHGTNPVSKEDCNLMVEKTQGVIILLVGKDWFKKVVGCATFPELNL